MATQIKLRRDTAANWTSEDPTLAEGEPGYEIDTGLLKIGDGSTVWTLLNYTTAPLPGNITQGYQANTLCPAGVDTVIYTSTAQYKHAVKLFVIVEGVVDGGGLNWETQGCDVIAVRGYNDNIVHVTAYGVTYSSASSFATFDGQWNGISNRMEITCQPNSATNSVTVSVHAIEMSSDN